jgi:hypothetical protein
MYNTLNRRVDGEAHASFPACFSALAAATGRKEFPISAHFLAGCSSHLPLSPVGGNPVRAALITGRWSLPGSGVAFITVAAARPDGQVLLVNPMTGAVLSTLAANPDRSGGSADIAFFGSKIYFANQADGSVSVLPVTASGAAAGP